MRLRVQSHVSRNAPEIQTQEGKDNLPAGAGKPELRRFQRVALAEWPAPDGESDPWENPRAARWMGQAGQAAVRAGLLAWSRAAKESEVQPRDRGILVTGVEGGWPGWLRHRAPAEIAGSWRSIPPLWLLEYLPNLPAAQLAIETGARGPVESRRAHADEETALERTLGRWQRRGVRKVLVVRSSGIQARAEVWTL